MQSNTVPSVHKSKSLIGECLGYCAVLEQDLTIVSNIHNIS